MNKFRSFRGLVVGVAAIALLAGGLATASNMGFKFVPSIPGTAGANNFNLSLPWNNNYAKAEDLRADVPNCQRVARVEANTKLTSWFGAGNGGGTNFVIVKGAAYIVSAKAAGSQPVIVGSHDPNFTYSFTANQALNAAAPYHQTYTKADNLLLDLRAQTGDTVGTPTISRVAKFEANTKLTSWFGVGRGGGSNFNLDLGKGVVIFPVQTKSGFVWAHY